MKPNQRNEVKTRTKEVSTGNWVVRQPAYTVPDPKPLAGDVDENEEVRKKQVGKYFVFLFKTCPWFFPTLAAGHIY